MNKIKALATDYAYAARGQHYSLRYFTPPKRWLEGDKKTEVLLIQGYYETWQFLLQVGDFLNSKGYKIHVVKEIKRNTKTVAQESSKILDYIEKNNLGNLVIVAHSKGGLVALSAMKQDYEDRIVKLIAIAAPFSGTSLAKSLTRLGAGDAAKEMLPDSTYIKELTKTDKVAKVVSVFPVYDNHVIHKNGSYLEGAKNVKIKVEGHHRIVFSKQVKDLLLEELAS